MIYAIEPDGSLRYEWLFFEDDENGRLVVREEYGDLVCPACGKIDEAAALARGIGDGFRCRTDRDLVATSEDWLCASARFREFVEASRLEGLGFVPVPHSDYHVVQPTTLVETDETAAGFENHRLCGTCGRYSERVAGPLLAGMQLPESHSVFFGSSIANENVKVAYRPCFAHEDVIDLLKSRDFDGIDFVAAH